MTHNLKTPNKVRKLQQALYAKAKTQPTIRFHALWDKVYRMDFLEEAFRRCRANDGMPGVDGESFDDIEAQGRNLWLAKLQQELKEGTYLPQPLLRIWIPKSNGGKRPLGIATIKDRVAQQSALLVLEPIFEADLDENQFGFRPKRSAKMALKEIQDQITTGRKTDVLDADLRDYFNTIPHGNLLRSIARRVVDGKMLAMIKQWLRVPVVERQDRTKIQTTEAKDKKRGIPQGSPLSPLLSNVYFRRVFQAWKLVTMKLGIDAQIVNYADDFVICAKPGTGKAAFNAIQAVVQSMGLSINGEKTKLLDATRESFDFLGYTFSSNLFGRYGKKFQWYCPSKKSIQKIVRKIRDLTSVRTRNKSNEDLVEGLNLALRGWKNYFEEGYCLPTFRKVRRYVERKIANWMLKKYKRGKKEGSYFYTDQFLYQELGLYKLPRARRRAG